MGKKNWIHENNLQVSGTDPKKNNPQLLYGKVVLRGKSKCSDWFLLGQDFAISVISGYVHLSWQDVSLYYARPLGKSNGREHLWSLLIIMFKANRFVLRYVENDLTDLATSCGLIEFSLNSTLCILLVVLSKYFGRSDVITIKQI